MTKMNAAVVTSFTEPPHYQPFEVPAPSDGEVLADVLAAGLHPRVRSGAAGQHYTSSGTLPMIPGVDGVGRLPDGKLVYFAADDDVLGTMADKALVDPRRSVELPAGVDVAKVAAAMNPAMSSWVALRRRVPMKPGQSVLILGATGNAGAMAVQVARRLGAGRVVGAGRDPERLRALLPAGAEDVVQLTDDADATCQALAAAAAEVDIVLDYLWGRPAGQAIMALLSARSDRARALDWDPDRRGRGPDDRVAVGGAALGQLPPPGQRPGLRLAARLPRRAARADRGDQRGHHRGPSERGTAVRRRAGLDRQGGPRRAHRAGARARLSPLTPPGPPPRRTARQVPAPRQAPAPHRAPGRRCAVARRWRRAPRPPRRR
jgi:hypothetical protein